jgi:multiple sugar transport system substrate-binding protein
MDGEPMRRTTTWMALAVAMTLLAAACGGGDGDADAGGDAGGDTESAAAEGDAAEGDGTIVVWSTESEPDRLEKTRAIADAFTEATGVEVDLQGIDEEQFATLVQSSAAAGDLPDAMTLPLNFAQSYAAEGITDPARAGAVVETLGADTFSERSLSLFDFEGTPAAVPSDGWGQLLLYRTDLFEEAGLDPPDTFDAIQAAAEALNTDEVAGITAATVPGEPFTQETFEHFALANNCQLTDDEGTVTLDSPECTEALGFYTDLMANYSVEGAQDVDTTRATYFAGQAAMVVWSSFILDELAGLRDDAAPTCPECGDDPEYLAQNTGIVTAFAGPDADGPSQFGNVSSWAITEDAAPETEQFVEFMLSDGYLDWLAIAPEGKFPVRAGNADNPTEYVDGWGELEAGVDSKAPLGDIYGEEVITALTEGPETFTRWGFPQGQGQLVGAVYGDLPLPNAIAEILDGTLDTEAAIEEVQADVTDLQDSL